MRQAMRFGVSSILDGQVQSGPLGWEHLGFLGATDENGPGGKTNHWNILGWRKWKLRSHRIRSW